MGLPARAILQSGCVLNRRLARCLKSFASKSGHAGMD